MTSSRTLWLLHLEGPDDPRFSPALEFLQDGRSIGYRGVSMRLNPETFSCCMQASWRRENLTVERALADFARIRQTIEELRKERPDFDAATRTRVLRLSLVDDYGQGVVELCHLADGEVVGLPHGS